MSVAVTKRKMSIKHPTPFNWSWEQEEITMEEYLENLIKTQVILEGNPHEYIKFRSEGITNILTISKHYELKNETVFKAVQIFDMYYWKSIKLEDFHTCLDEQKINIVLAISIASKMEEVNCNFLEYFYKNLIKGKIKQKITLQIFAQKESVILKAINFRLTAPNFLDFNYLFFQMILIRIHRINSEKNQDKSRYKLDNFIYYFMKLNNQVTIRYASLNEAFLISPFYSGLICLKATLYIFKHKHEADVNYLDSYLSNSISSISNIEFINKVSMSLFINMVKDEDSSSSL
jgi:hypothetical protein